MRAVIENDLESPTSRLAPFNPSIINNPEETTVVLCIPESNTISPVYKYVYVKSNRLKEYT